MNRSRDLLYLLCFEQLLPAVADDEVCPVFPLLCTHLLGEA
jgi:hypothetical protein